MLDTMLTLMDGTKVDEDQILGVITIFSVPDEAVPGTKLNRLWAAEGLNPAFIPDVRKPTDVFANACRKVETRRAGSSNGHRTEVKVDEVSNGPDERVYQVTRMVRDQVNQVIDHPKAMRLVLDKHSAEGGAVAADCIDVQPLDPSTFGVLKGLSDTIVKTYDANLSTVPGQKIRNALRDCLDAVNGESLRKSGGVYFVPKSGVDTLEALSRVTDALYAAAADVQVYPQLNTKTVKDAVAAHHAANVVAECDAMIARITERLKSKHKVRKDLLTNLMQQRRELGARRRLYADLLGQESKKLAGHFDLLDDQIERLMDAAV